MQPRTWKATSVTPCSANVCTPGSFFIRFCRNCDRTPLAGLKHVLRDEPGAGAALQRSGQEVGPHRRFAAVVHGFHVQAVVLVQLRDDDMSVGAGGVGADVRLVLARILGELVEIGDAGAGSDDGRQAACRHVGQQHEVLVGIIRQVLVEHLVHDHRRRDREEDRVAVGRRTLDLHGADRAAGTGLVLDDHRLSDFFEM